MENTKKKSLLRNFTSYAFGNVLGLMAGLLSFPLFTRTLTLSEYGTLSLLNAALSLLTCLSKGGIQNTINRFWVADGDNTELVSSSYSGVVSCFVLITVITSPGFLLGWFGHEYAKFSMMVLFACYVTVFFEVIRSVSNNISIIKKNAFQYSLLNSCHKYLRIILPYLGVLVFADRLLGIAIGFMVASITTASILLYRQNFAWKFQFDKKRLSTLLIFGFPLMLNELVDYCLAFCDRFFLAHYLNVSAVGVYSAAYNLSNNVQVVLITSMGMTSAPLLLERFNDCGFDEMKRLLRCCITWYCLLGGGVVALSTSVGPDLLVFLASSKYSEASTVMLPILAGVFLYGLFGLATSTLFFRNQTKVILVFCFAAAVINILANWLLVPELGIMGAALATLFSYLFLGVVGMNLAYDVRFNEILYALVRLVPALIMGVTLQFIDIPDHLLNILLKSSAGMLVWSLFSYLLFSEVRTGVRGLIHEAKARWLKV